ncbi:MAG TPA: tripartite tricarboxylate transporter substrate binding protein [Burkholderiales bacterium]|nr:tripartite tricarboxylate transporter substrate binding protein [Burkholderiales bacterium]
MNVKRSLIALCAVALAAVSFCAAAQNYPEKTILYWQAFPTGGESDISARHQQFVFKKKFPNIEMIVQYKPGAGGGLMWAQMNNLPGDGYNVIGINLPHIVLQPLEGLVQYKTEDVTPVYWFHYTPDALVVSDKSPFKTFQDFLKAAKAKPGELTLAGSGTNSANHVAHEKLNGEAGITTRYVPFKGTGDLTTAVIGMHVTGAMSYTAFAMAQKGKVHPLAIAMERRHPAFPDVPTFKELGYNWVDGAYRGIGVPKSTPLEMRKRIADLWSMLNQDPEMKRLAAEAGFELIDIGLEKMPAFMAARTKDYMVSARRLGLVK